MWMEGIGDEELTVKFFGESLVLTNSGKFVLLFVPVTLFVYLFILFSYNTVSYSHNLSSHYASES